MQLRKLALGVTTKIQQIFTGTWKDLDDLTNVYTEEMIPLPDVSITLGCLTYSWHT